MDHLLFDCQWKAVGVGDGELAGYMSVFGNVDQGGDVVRPGAFKKTISDWSRAKSPMPLIADHNLSTDGVIGSVKSMAEDAHGVAVRARFSAIQKAQEIRTLMVEGHLSGMSFTYEPVRFSFGKKDGRDIRFLDEVKVFEATVTPFPMNQLAIASAKVSAMAGASKPYGDVSYADPGYLDSAGDQASSSGNTPQARYPLDTEAHCRAAWSYFHQGNNAAAYTATQRSTVEGRIRSALEQYGVTVSQSSSFDFDTLVPVLRTVLDIPDLLLQKTALDAALARYQPVQVADTADEPVTTNGAADTGKSAVDTPDDAAAYAVAIAFPPGPRDDAPKGEPHGALAYPQILETVRDQADLDALEAQINQALGRETP